MSEKKDIVKLLKRKQSTLKAIAKLQANLNAIQSDIDNYFLSSIKEIVSNFDHADSDILSQEDVCKLLGVSKTTLYRMRISNQIECIKPKGRKSVVYSRKAIEEYKEKHKQ